MAVASAPGRLSCFSARASTSGSSRARHAAGVGVDPAGPVDDGDLGHRSAGDGRQPGERLDVRDGDGGGLVQLADDRRGLLAGGLRARARSSRRAVRPARFQSTIEEALLIASR